MDIADASFNEEQATIISNINKACKPKKNKLFPDGYCHNCFEDVTDNKIFCNDVCATQHSIAERSHFPT